MFTDFCLARYNSDGSPDTSFGSGGRAATAIGVNNSDVRALALQSNGKIVVAGPCAVGVRYQFCLARYDTDGSLDDTFGSGGRLITVIDADGDSFAQAVAIQSDDKIVAAGYCHSGQAWVFCLARYQIDGSLDSTFDSDGLVLSAVGTVSDRAHAVAIQSDGKIVAAGECFTDTGWGFCLARYNTSGRLDTSFDREGQGTTNVASGGHAFAVTIQNDGRIVAAGWCPQANGSEFCLARFGGGATGQAPMINGTPSNPVTVGTPYSFAFTVTGTPTPTVTLNSGALPPGLGLSAAGVLSGTPTSAGSYQFTVRAANGVVPDAVTGTLTIVADPAPVAPAISGTPSSPATVGTPYSFAFTVTGTPAPTVTPDSGGLPPGITLTAAGVLSGTPRAQGTYQFTVRAANGVVPDAVTGTHTIVVDPALLAPTISGTSTSPATVGTPYSFAFTLAGTPAPTVTLNSGTLPPGLTLSSAGVLSGTPTANGTFQFTARAANGVSPDAVSGTLTIVVNPAPVAPTISGTPTTPATVGAAYNFGFTVAGTPAPVLTLDSGTLPPGVTLSTGGVLSGTPTTAGAYRFTVRATNGVPADAVTGTLTIVVNPAPVAPTLSGTPTSPPTVGTPYSFAFTVSGTPAPSVTLNSGALPPGTTLSAAGVLSGTPTTQGNYQFTARAANGVSPDAVTGTLTVVVNAAPAGNSPPAAAGNVYAGNQGNALTVAAPGVLGNDSDPDAGTTLTAVLIAGPANGTLTLNPNGSFTYTPRAGFSGADSFTYRASDGSLQSGVATVTINVASLANIIGAQTTLTSRDKSILQSTLASAATSYSRGNTLLACATLDLFRLEVSLLQRTRPPRLSAATATVLVNGANSLKYLYGCPVR